MRMKVKNFLGFLVIGFVLLSNCHIWADQSEEKPLSCEDDFNCPAQMKCENYVCVSVGCIAEGEALPGAISPEYKKHMATECCQGLKVILWPKLFDEDCRWTRLIGAPSGVCSNCGNGTCENWETKCNCPEDCRKEGECAAFGQEIRPEEYNKGVRCCEGLSEISPVRFHHSCSPESDICKNGCVVPPPYEIPWVQCSPCGNEICEFGYGENKCNCPEDCK
ncbi:MAG: hypothetical protein KAS87_00060 [Candidatus Omnitrophica bacterium]|nr:hypothetical protein [Candidatus Omnitrophota bacterium]